VAAILACLQRVLDACCLRRAAVVRCAAMFATCGGRFSDPTSRGMTPAAFS
jgi:hypothetical protein